MRRGQVDKIDTTQQQQEGGDGEQPALLLVYALALFKGVETGVENEISFRPPEKPIGLQVGVFLMLAAHRCQLLVETGCIRSFLQPHQELGSLNRYRPQNSLKPVVFQDGFIRAEGKPSRRR